MGVAGFFIDEEFPSLYLTHTMRIMYVSIEHGVRTAMRFDRELRYRWSRYCQNQVLNFDLKQEMLGTPNQDTTDLYAKSVQEVQQRITNCNNLGYFSAAATELFCSGKDLSLEKKKTNKHGGTKGGGTSWKGNSKGSGYHNSGKKTNKKGMGKKKGGKGKRKGKGKGKGHAVREEQQNQGGTDFHFG
jgi:hypothetical protein